MSFQLGHHHCTYEETHFDISMRLFWPKTGVSTQNGVLVGWRVGDTLVVTTTVENGTERAIQKQYIPSSSSTRILDQLRVLGHAYLAYNTSSSTHDRDYGFKIWIDHSSQPIACSEAIQVVLYSPPHTSRLRFLTLRPNSSSSTRSPIDVSIRVRNAKQDVFSIGTKVNERKDDIQGIIPFLNTAESAQKYLKGSSSVKSSSSNCKQELGVKQARCPRESLNTLGGVTSVILNYQLRLGDWHVGSLRSTSACVDQIFLRVRQLLAAPGEFTAIRRLGEEPISERSRRYMHFWSTIWLVLNDLIIGYCTNQILMVLIPLISNTLPRIFSVYLVSTLIAALRWLNDWPVGLKLNTPLSAFFCASFDIIIRSWSNLVHPILENLTPVLVKFLALTSLCGLTLLLSLCRDLLGLFTLHIHLCSAITMAITRWQLSSLGGLWNLFRGKRWNVLRQRTDSYAYDVDQLFLGTLLFTVSIFLLPTVLTYSALFALSRMVVCGIDNALKIAIMALNAFPLFEIMLRIKEPSRLPNGIALSLKPVPHSANVSVPSSAHPILQVMELKNSPRSFTDIFRPRISPQTR